MPKPIALLTDFGTVDWFTGEMKGIILSILPETVIIDITHQIEPGNVRQAAFTLLACKESFPKGTVFCTVVDPGTGSNRRPIAVKTQDHSFIGPDNGCLSWILDKNKNASVCHIVNDQLFRPKKCAVFQGRDLFAPVAAYIAGGMDFSTLGPLIQDPVIIPFPKPLPTPEGSVTGEIIHIDHFGNALTNIDMPALLSADIDTPAKIRLKSGIELPVDSFYHKVKPGEVLGYMGSAGFLEIGINQGNASESMRLVIGDPVEAF